MGIFPSSPGRILPGMAGTPLGVIWPIDGLEGVVLVSDPPDFLCLEVEVDGEAGGMVAAVHVSVTGQSSDLTFFTIPTLPPLGKPCP